MPLERFVMLCFFTGVSVPGYFLVILDSQDTSVMLMMVMMRGIHVMARVGIDFHFFSGET